MAGIRLNLLGGFTAVDAKGHPLLLQGRKDRALLAYLAVNGTRRHSREKLGKVLWDGDGDERHSLRQSLANLRRALGRNSQRILSTTRYDVAVDPTMITIDAAELEGLVKSGSLGDLETASRIYAGPFLDGLDITSSQFDAWQTAERERLALLVKEALGRLIDLYAVANALDKALAAAVRLVELDPFDEEARRTLMLLHADRGQGNAAIASYKAFSALLERELNVQPEPETRQIYELLIDAMSPRPKRSRNRPTAIDGTPLPVTGNIQGAKHPLNNLLEHAVFALEQVPACIMVTNMSGEIVGWNAIAQRTFGYKKTEVLGKPPGFLHGADHGRPQKLITAAIEKGGWTGLLRLVAKDRTARWHKRTVLPLKDPNGQVIAIFGISRPLTRAVPQRTSNRSSPKQRFLSNLTD